MQISAAPGFASAHHLPVRADRPESTNPVGATEKPVEEAGEPKARGVMRLLQDNHFKGVAELRHRIRLHDELAAQANEDAAAVITDGADDLTAAVREGVDALVGALGETETAEEGSTAPEDSTGALLDEFEAAVAQATSGDGDPIDLQEVEVNLQAAFASLIESLQTTYAAPTDETAVETVADETRETDSRINLIQTLDPDRYERLHGDAAIEGETESATTLLDDAIAALTATFQEALAGLLAEAEETLRLPDPSPAPGNGAAYEKFLAMYDDLRGATTSTIDATA